MSISTIKIAFKYLTGGIDSVVQYLLDILNKALAGLTEETKEKTKAILNLATKVLSILEFFKFLVPTKWQVAYEKLLDSVGYLCLCLDDLKLTEEEYSKMKGRFAAAIADWNSDDDEDCADPECEL